MKKIILVLLCCMLAISAFAKTKPPSKSGEAVYLLGLDKYLMGIPTGVTSGTAVNNGTARAISKSQDVYGVCVQAVTSNTGHIWIGGSDVTVRHGFLIAVTPPVVRFRVDNLTDIYFIGNVFGDELRFIGETR